MLRKDDPPIHHLTCLALFSSGSVMPFLSAGGARRQDVRVERPVRPCRTGFPHRTAIALLLNVLSQLANTLACEMHLAHCPLDRAHSRHATFAVVPRRLVLAFGLLVCEPGALCLNERSWILEIHPELVVHAIEFPIRLSASIASTATDVLALRQLLDPSGGAKPLLRWSGRRQEQ